MPADVWPNFVCDENGGTGWDATVLKVVRQSALVSFDRARTDDGRRYADERVAISALRPHPTRARPPAAASAPAPAAPAAGAPEGHNEPGESRAVGCPAALEAKWRPPPLF